MTAGGKSTGRAARELALNLLFQMDVAGLPLDEALATARENARVPAEALERGLGLAAGAWGFLPESDRIVNELAPSWTVDRQSSVDRNILRLALYEMLQLQQPPGPVVINEAVEMAKVFGSEDSGRFVNGVLAAAHRRVQQGEMRIGDECNGS